MYAEIALTLMLGAGTLLAYYDEARALAERLRTDIIAGSRADGLRTDNIERKRRAVDRLIRVTLGASSSKADAVFICLSVIPALIFIFIMSGKLETYLLAAASVFIALIPFMLLRLKLRMMRAAASREGAVLLTELLDNYKMNYFNMREAIEVTAATIAEAPASRKLTYNLSEGLNRAGNEREIEGLLKDFRYAMGTTWADVLAVSLYTALTSGMRVDEALEDLIRALDKAADIEEYIRRENNESGLILKYLVPGCCLLTLIAALRYFGLTASELLHYQFGTAAGVAWLTVAAVFYLAAVFAREFLTRNTLDI